MKPFESTRVLLWAGQADVLAAVGQALSRLGCQLHPADSFERLQKALETEPFDLVVSQLCEYCMGPLDLLSRLAGKESSPPVLIVVDSWNMNLYLEALRRGAFDAVALPLNENELIRIVSRALEARSVGFSPCGGRS